MARYLVLIYGDEQVWADASPQWHRENSELHGVFHERAGSAVRMAAEVAPSAQAVSVRGADGRATPGPYVASAPIGIGGFYLLEADGIDQAVELARGLPEASNPSSGIEVRPIVAG